MRAEGKAKPKGSVGFMVQRVDGSVEHYPTFRQKVIAFLRRIFPWL